LFVKFGFIQTDLKFLNCGLCDGKKSEKSRLQLPSRNVRKCQEMIAFLFSEKPPPPKNLKIAHVYHGGLAK
jgi:hypothetical protein